MLTWPDITKTIIPAVNKCRAVAACYWFCKVVCAVLVSILAKITARAPALVDNYFRLSSKNFCCR